MAEYRGEFPQNEGRILTVGFMKNELPKYHPYYEDPPVHYDNQDAHYVNVQHAEVPEMTSPTPGPEASKKPEENACKAMTYWNMIFPSAMKELKSMPEVKAPKSRKPASLIHGLEAVAKGGDYEKPLRDSLTAITARSKKLMAQVLKTHTRDFHRYSRASLQIFELIQEGQGKVADNVTRVIENTDVLISAADGMNAKLNLLLDKHEEAVERIRRQNSEIHKQKDRIYRQSRELIHSRSTHLQGILANKYLPFHRTSRRRCTKD
ncbi:hypothetical protein F4813DRAFT_389397 [Daldinia decipiens]|uniref:uncharacterized protein n=1 Tax=Daldinia decipiens TaxID=326647 RepID=UPI0020C46243|nr:uncharacterized protein F4813DRAFT_389397 [Daldinia decipiens]KAI1657660.1 hypothetical protein F4813DRAFT_389397 [Daldinia decipiens]